MFRGSSRLLILVWRSQYSKYSVPSASLRSFTSVQHIWRCSSQPLNPNGLNSSTSLCWLKPRHSRLPVVYSRNERLLRHRWQPRLQMFCFPCLLFSGLCNEHPAPSLFAQTHDLRRCFLNTSRSSSDDWSLLEAWRFIIAPIFPFTVTINSLRKSLIWILWLYLFHFSVFLLGFQKLGEQANISSSFRQRLFVFLFLDK